MFLLSTTHGAEACGRRRARTVEVAASDVIGGKHRRGPAAPPLTEILSESARTFVASLATTVFLGVSQGSMAESMA